MVSYAEPIVERERFFAGPRDRARTVRDGQVEAVRRMLGSCDRVRPHLESHAALAAFVASQANPARVRRRIAVALAIEEPFRDRVYGVLLRDDLEAFRQLAQAKLPAVVWVFT
jgi:hypothetical protein